MATNTKLGDRAQDSYVTASQADTYFGNRRDTTEWDNIATTSNKEVVLKQAAQDIDIFNYVGEKYYDSQGLAFPRNDHKIVTGNCTASITNTSFRHGNLKSSTYGKYPTSYWKYGSVHITTGTPLNDIKLIASSNTVTGSITVATFTATPTTNTGFIVFAPIDKNIRNAQCEQALFILKNANIESLYNYRDAGAREVEIGDVRVSFGSSASDKIAISPEARKLLSRWIRKQVKVGRA
uniref:Putative head tail connector protein n=1 Tax=viral metagenome TaxID=1070528 RepID=A0A6M3JQ00_9ZZZZ